MAQIGDKYIIELNRKFEDKGKTIYGVKGFSTLVFDDYGLDCLVKYKEPETASGADKRAKIINHYGLRMQLFKLIEELTEAQTEVIKMITGKPDADVDHLIEELADVALLTDQITEFYNKILYFMNTYNYKQDRTLKRIDAENAKALEQF